MTEQTTACWNCGFQKSIGVDACAKCGLWESKKDEYQRVQPQTTPKCGIENCAGCPDCWGIRNTPAEDEALGPTPGATLSAFNAWARDVLARHSMEDQTDVE